MARIIQLRFSGFGGQGIVLVGTLLGHAGVIEKNYVCGSDSYGAQARGSICKSEVIFSDGPIDFPHLILADILVVMSQQAYHTDCEEVRKRSGLILFDQGHVVPKEGLNVCQIGIPATDHAVRKLKNKQVANMILLGALVDITGIVSAGSIRKTLRSRISQKALSLNLEAFQIGMRLGRKAHG
jgi:2-oxoglutarate ferredoxin oxidoreductase subunit gamma